MMIAFFPNWQDDKESHVVVARMEKEHPWIQKEQAEGGQVYMEERRIEVSGYLEGQRDLVSGNGDS